jgi:hypothetical protein
VCRSAVEKKGSSGRYKVHEVMPISHPFSAASALPPYRHTAVPPFYQIPIRLLFPPPGGDLASTGLMKELQRVQVQVPGKTVWNDSTANSNLALAA